MSQIKQWVERRITRLTAMAGLFLVLNAHPYIGMFIVGVSML